MSNRKNLMKSLGITDYPWSSDEEEDAAQNSTAGSRSRLNNENELPNSSRPNDPSPPPAPTVSPGRKNKTRLERELFWSLLNNTNRRAPILDPARPGPSNFQHSEGNQGLQNNISAIERMMAINQLPRKLSYYSSRPNRRCLMFNDRSLPMDAVVLPRQVGQFRPAAAPAQRSGRGDRTPSLSVPAPELNLNRSTEQQQDGINSEDDFDNRSRHSMSPAIVPLDDENADNVNAEPQADNAAPEEVVVEIEPDIETVDSSGADHAPADVRGEEVPNEEQPSASNDAESPPDRQGTKRKRDEYDENDINTVREFNQSVLRLLECPVCMEWMEPPMSQCRRGHLVCGPCRMRLSACPVCRTAFSSVRNRAMESVAELLRYPCRHGCGREARLRRRAAHEASCGARRYRCPAPPCADRPPLPLDELHYHFQARHLPIFKVGRRHKFSMRVNAEQHDTWLVMAARELFHLRVDVDVRTWGFVVYVAYIGPRCNANNFSYEVTVSGQHNSRKLVYTRATHSDLESSTLNVSRQDCFHLTLDQALNFLRLKNRHCEPDKYLDFVVEISKREASPAAPEGSDS